MLTTAYAKIVVLASVLASLAIVSGCVAHVRSGPHHNRGHHHGHHHKR